MGCFVAFNFTLLGVLDIFPSLFIWRKSRLLNKIWDTGALQTSLKRCQPPTKF